MYVAITRAKKAAMLSFSETRRVWGKTENTQPSRFLKEIDPDYLDANFDIEELHGRNRWERMVEDRPQREKPSFEALRNRYDIRRGGQYSNRPAAERPKQSPSPEIISTPPPVDPRRAGMRSVGVRATDSAANTSTTAPSALGPCAYKVGDRVVHPKFEGGTIERIEPLSTDHKLVVNFDKFGTKTLLAKFAKLTKE
jgi:DNA helicase-2/ATP-dependent DNA helicase PcrA